jgi:hypothetical protein
MDSKAASDLRLVDPLKGREGTVFDKPAPTGPPSPPKRQIPHHLMKLMKFLDGVVANESTLLDLCLDRAMEIVAFNCGKRRVGVDFDTNTPPEGYAQLAAPLAVELYRQSLESVKDRADEYAVILKEAQEEMARGQKPGPSILVP